MEGRARDERTLGERKMEIELRARELDLRKSTAERDQKSKESIASQLKLWGDGLRNTISKMPTEPIEIVFWFIALEKLFAQLEVPVELQSVLLRPYLNDPDKVKVVHEMKRPESKKQIRQVPGFFSFFRDYIPNFSAIAKPLTDLTGSVCLIAFRGVNHRKKLFRH